MPAEQGRGLDEDPAQTPTAKEPAQPGEQRPVAGPQRRAGHLATEHGHLMTEHDDLDREFALLRAKE